MFSSGLGSRECLGFTRKCALDSSYALVCADDMFSTEINGLAMRQKGAALVRFQYFSHTRGSTNRGERVRQPTGSSTCEFVIDTIRSCLTHLLYSMVVEITPIGIDTLGWKFYIIWVVLNGSFVPFTYLSYVSTRHR